MGRTRFLTPRRCVPLIAALVVGLTAAGASAEVQVPGGPEEAGVVEVPISFTVQNVNRSPILCPADGRTYTVRGVLVGPTGALTDGRYDAATLMLHGLSYGSFFSNFEAVPGYDYAAKQAQAGNVTVAIDRLGYDRSDKPNGFGVCIGSQADTAHQIVEKLRSGDYALEGQRAKAFSRVVLAGHSVGGQIAQVVAHSFGDVDGLVVLSYSDVVVSDAAVTALGLAAGVDCRVGGQPAEGGVPGYVPFGRTPADFLLGHFNPANAEAEIVRLSTDERNLDPCGDVLSYLGAVAANLANLSKVTVPVLVLSGAADALFPPPAVDTQAALFTGSRDVSRVTIPDTGHALTLHRSRDEFQGAVASWLAARGFSGPRPTATLQLR